jgi:peroxiredoxin
MKTSSAEIPQAQMETPMVNRGQRRWLPYLTLALLLELVVLAHLLPRDLWFNMKIGEWQTQRQNWQREQQRRALMKNDPLLERQAPAITISSVDGRKIRLGHQPTIVVFIGTCTSCVAANLTEWERVQNGKGERLAIVIVSRDTKQRIHEFLKRTPLTMPVLPDEHGVLAKAYNAVWIPRIYGVDESARLVWIQKDTYTKDAQTMAQEIWQRIGGASRK